MEFLKKSHPSVPKRTKCRESARPNRRKRRNANGRGQAAEGILRHRLRAQRKHPDRTAAGETHESRKEPGKKACEATDLSSRTRKTENENDIHDFTRMMRKFFNRGRTNYTSNVGYFLKHSVWQTQEIETESEKPRKQGLKKEIL